MVPCALPWLQRVRSSGCWTVAVPALLLGSCSRAPQKRSTLDWKPMNVNFAQVIERLGRRRLQNGNFAWQYIWLWMFLVDMPAIGFRSFHLHHPDRNWCANAGQASYAMCLWRRRFPWPQGCLGSMANQPTWLLLYPYPLLVWWLFGILGNTQESFLNISLMMVQNNSRTYSTVCCEGLTCALIWQVQNRHHSSLPAGNFRKPWNWKKFNSFPPWTPRFTR